MKNRLFQSEKGTTGMGKFTTVFRDQSHASPYRYLAQHEIHRIALADNIRGKTFLTADFLKSISPSGKGLIGQRDKRIPGKVIESNPN